MGKAKICALPKFPLTVTVKNVVTEELLAKAVSDTLIDTVQIALGTFGAVKVVVADVGEAMVSVPLSQLADHW